MSAVMGLVMLAVGSSAGAQNLPGLGVSAAVQALDANAAAKPLGSATQSVTQILAKPAVAATTAVATSAVANVRALARTVTSRAVAT